MPRPAELENLNCRIETALRAFRAAWYGGQKPDVDEFCRSRPECGPELRARIENFLFVVRSIDNLSC